MVETWNPLGSYKLTGNSRGTGGPPRVASCFSGITRDIWGFLRLKSECGVAWQLGMMEVEAPIGVEMEAVEQRKAREVEAYGEVAERFHEYDADGNGFLDEGEVLAFCNSLGLNFTDEQARYEQLCCCVRVPVSHRRADIRREQGTSPPVILAVTQRDRGAFPLVTLGPVLQSLNILSLTGLHRLQGGAGRNGDGWHAGRDGEPGGICVLVEHRDGNKGHRDGGRDARSSARRGH